MKQIVVVGSRKSGSKNNPLSIAQAFEASSSVSARVIYWEDIVFHIATNKVDVLVDGVSLFDDAFDAVLALGWYKNGSKSYYRDVAYALALVLKSRSIAFWNAEMGQQRSTTKLSAMVLLALEGISVPNTTFSITFNVSTAERPYPFIAKAIATSRGKSNFLVVDDDTLERARATDAPMLIQDYLENTHDLRVICFAGEPTLILRRSRGENSETHLNNTSQGGSAEWLDIATADPELLTNSRKISKIMYREMAGIDFIPDAASPIGYSCLEVNAIPQLTSGTDVDVKLTAFIKTIETLD